GKEPDLYIALKPGKEASDELAKKISDAVCTEIGKIAKPRKVWIVTDMPKTRSGKIMRRVLGAISNDKDVGDVTTLANPDIVEEIKKMAKG
ncbi:MAG: acetyl-coenzyme A synthetase, partial [Desulfobacterales bacterium]